MRLDNPEIIANLKKSLSEFPAQPSTKDVFLALREMRNHW